VQVLIVQGLGSLGLRASPWLKQRALVGLALVWAGTQMSYFTTGLFYCPAISDEIDLEKSSLWRLKPD
jgi:hypothetical protein